MANKTGDYSSVALNEANTATQKVYCKDMAALMCSGSDSGLVSLFQVKFWVMNRLVPYKSNENDVWWSSRAVLEEYLPQNSAKRGRVAFTRQSSTITTRLSVLVMDSSIKQKCL